MSSARRSALRALKAWITKSVEREMKLVKGTGELGTRAVPTRSGNNDQKIGARLDFGPKIKRGGKEYRMYYFQLNKNAENSTLKELAAKNSHKNWSEVEVEINSNPTEAEAGSVIERMFETLEENMV